MSDPHPVKYNSDALVARFCDVRQRTEALASPLSAEDQTVQSMSDTSPTKWHRAHTTWFFDTFLLVAHEAGYEPFDPTYNYLWNSYYEAVGERFPRPNRGLLSRPGIDDIAAYRADTDRRIRALLESASEDELGSLGELIALGTHHEEQHQELILMDIKHVLSANPFGPAYAEAPTPEFATSGPFGWVDIEGTTATIGRPADADGFAFDNEGPQHDVLLQPFRMADRLVTAGEWLEFMADGGYQRHDLWLSDGWHLSQREGWDAPLYWRNNGDPTELSSWRVHTLHGLVPVDPEAPVCHISFYEADAFATWKGARLPTEFEWEHVANGRPVTGRFMTDAGPAGTVGIHPAPAGPPTGEIRQLFGDCWEWTESAYRPFPGYRPPPGAIGEYNGKFMINTMVLRGGCAFTPPGHTRATYRNFFHPHTRWHLSGVRLASDV